ncbi:MAG: hypothetical protein HFG12_02450 [Oscillibacter sp.]|jgi:hypothetical protein|nr:hypothetical protein [uncultured Oscillibacter sp.]MCI8812089.1 hypothetical protein [Oscillibacter sp.]
MANYAFMTLEGRQKEVVKKLTWEKVPTNLLAFIVAMAMTLLAFFAVCRILAVAVAVPAFLIIIYLCKYKFKMKCCRNILATDCAKYILVQVRKSDYDIGMEVIPWKNTRDSGNTGKK